MDESYQLRFILKKLTDRLDKIEAVMLALTESVKQLTDSVKQLDAKKKQGEK